MNERTQRRSAPRRAVLRVLRGAPSLARAHSGGRPATGKAIKGRTARERMVSGRTGGLSRRRRVATAGLVAALLGGGWWLAAPTPTNAGEITVYQSPTC